MKRHLTLTIENLMKDEVFQEYLDSGDIFGCVSFAKGYLSHYPEIYELLDTIIKHSIKAMA